MVGYIWGRMTIDVEDFTQDFVIVLILSPIYPTLLLYCHIDDENVLKIKAH